MHKRVIMMIVNLSWQAFKSLQMTSFSLKCVVPFLLSNGFSYVLTEKFLPKYFQTSKIHSRMEIQPQSI